MKDLLFFEVGSPPPKKKQSILPKLKKLRCKFVLRPTPRKAYKLTMKELYAQFVFRGSYQISKKLTWKEYLV